MRVSCSLAICLVALCLLTGCGKSPFVGGWRQKDDILETELLIRKNGTGKKFYKRQKITPESIKSGAAPEVVKNSDDFTWKSKGDTVVLTMATGDPGPDYVLMLRPDGTLVRKSLNVKDSREEEFTSFPDVYDK